MFLLVILTTIALVIFLVLILITLLTNLSQLSNFLLQVCLPKAGMGMRKGKREMAKVKAGSRVRVGTWARPEVRT